MGRSGQTFVVAGQAVACGETKNVRLKVSESYTGQSIDVPIQVQRGPRPGPALFVAGAVHGDEINGTGIIHELMNNQAVELQRGTLVLMPVVNILGFERHSRYAPDRRDVNRSFPGTASGNLAARLAHLVFSEIVKKCDYGIDLHAAALRRTNFPSIRATMKVEGVAKIAEAFGCEVIVNSKGPRGSLRRCACQVGRPTIAFEAGEVWKVEPGVVEIGLSGIRNVLIELGMLTGAKIKPVYQTRVNKTVWLRAERGGFVKFHTSPGDPIDAGQAIYTVVGIFGHEEQIVCSPFSGIILGMTTMPVVKPGMPVCHIAIPKMKVSKIRTLLSLKSAEAPEHRLRDQLATNVLVQDTTATE